jgi:hypothetical protein
MIHRRELKENLRIIEGGKLKESLRNIGVELKGELKNHVRNHCNIFDT